MSKFVEPTNKLSKYDEKGQEIMDPEPVALHAKFTRPIPLGERMRQLVRDELLARELDEKGAETFEDADDFDVDNDVDPSTPYEESFDPLHTTSREQELRAGFVEERPAERKVKAKQVIESHLNAPKPLPKSETKAPIAEK